MAPLTIFLAALPLVLSLFALDMQKEATTAAESLSESEVKAAFLLNFTRFVEWPTTRGADRPFHLCIWGEDPFGQVLDQIVQGERVSGRPIAIRRIHAWPEPCDLLFLNGPDHQVAEILKNTGPGVLTISDAPGFLRLGGIIRFLLDNRRVRFEINRRAADQASLRISSRLLSLAKAVLP